MSFHCVHYMDSMSCAVNFVYVSYFYILRQRDGFSPYNKIYEFEYNILNQQNVTMTMTSLSGHMLNFEFSGSYRKW